MTVCVSRMLRAFMGASTRMPGRVHPISLESFCLLFIGVEARWERHDSLSIEICIHLSSGLLKLNQIKLKLKF